MTPENVYGGRERQRSKDFKNKGNGERGQRSYGVSQGKVGNYPKNQGERSQNDRGRKETKESYGKRDGREFRKDSGYQGRYQNQNTFRPKDKDDDYESRPRVSKPRRTDKDDDLSRIREQQTDKLIIMKKLEKEQKAMKKKSEEKKRSQSSRPMPKQKRSKNINYTRQYENGMFEDYEDWYENDF